MNVTNYQQALMTNHITPISPKVNPMKPYPRGATCATLCSFKVVVTSSAWLVCRSVVGPKKNHLIQLLSRHEFVKCEIFRALAMLFMLVGRLQLTAPKKMRQRRETFQDKGVQLGCSLQVAVGTISVIIRL